MSKNKCPASAGTSETAGSTIIWDWKEQPPWHAINHYLKPYGCQIAMIENGTDQFEAVVVPVQSNAQIEARRE